MATTDEKLINYLNHLISICNEGRHGYEVAAKNTGSEDLKTIFYSFIVDRDEFARALKYEVRKLGGEPEKGSVPLGALHKTWIDLKASVTTQDDKAILGACLTGDRAVISAYKEVLEKAMLPADTRNLVALQHIRIKEALEKIETLFSEK
jgi:uncharacterized protein (TIGR02284 family)